VRIHSHFMTHVSMTIFFISFKKLQYSLNPYIINFCKILLAFHETFAYIYFSQGKCQLQICHCDRFNVREGSLQSEFLPVASQPPISLFWCIVHINKNI
jgi:hypothetical protein